MRSDSQRLVVDGRGACLTELMVSLTTGAIVLAATLDMAAIMRSHADYQYRTAAEQQDFRLGLEVFEQEVRLATAPSIVTAAPQELLFLANVSGQHTITTGPVSLGQTELPVQDGSGWDQGKYVMLCSPQQCESHRLARNGLRSQLSLVEPVGMNFGAGTSVEVSNRVRYYTRLDQPGTVTLMRMVDGGASTLIGPLQLVHFSYWDKDGRATAVPSEISRITIQLSFGQSRTVARDIALRS